MPVSRGPAGRLAGKIALITGAGGPQGIGFACARIFDREGARLAITSTTSRIHERATALNDALGFVADLTDSAQADAVAKAALEAHGRIDLLVNNAGMLNVHEAEVTRELAAFTDEEWHRGIDINLTTAFNVTRSVLPGMVAQRYGRIINVASVTGPVVSNPRSGLYAAAKAGMVGLTRSLAVEVGRQGITVNAVLPGWILTGSSTATEIVAGQHTPIGRSGTPEEVA